jgi:hypothetical protein
MLSVSPWVELTVVTGFAVGAVATGVPIGGVGFSAGAGEGSGGFAESEMEPQLESLLAQKMHPHSGVGVAVDVGALVGLLEKLGDPGGARVIVATVLTR